MLFNLRQGTALESFYPSTLAKVHFEKMMTHKNSEASLLNQSHVQTRHPTTIEQNTKKSITISQSN